VPVERDTIANAGSAVTIGVRPEDVVVSNTEGTGLKVTVDLVEELGADGYLYGHSEVEGKRTDIVGRVDGRIHPNAGDTVYITPKPGHVHVFHAESGERLGGAVVD
jgi:multiple sugar transport system ATP-binding protein